MHFRANQKNVIFDVKRPSRVDTTGLRLFLNLSQTLKKFGANEENVIFSCLGTPKPIKPVRDCFLHTCRLSEMLVPIEKMSL